MKSISSHWILTQPAQNMSHSFYYCFIVVKPKGQKVVQVPIFTIVISSRRPPATGHWPPATGHRLTGSPAHRPPAHRLTGHRPPATCSPAHRPPATRQPPGHLRPATGHRPPATGHPLTGHRLTGHRLTATRHPVTGHATHQQIPYRLPPQTSKHKSPAGNNKQPCARKSHNNKPPCFLHAVLI
jgi:hypothetical protein